MSGAGENRGSWQRPQGRGNRTSGSNTPSKDGGRQQAMNALSGNAWKGKAAGGADRAQAQAQPAPVKAEQHVPVKDFNAGEVKEFLRKRYLESVGDQQAAYHKVQGDSVAKRSSGAWGSRGNMSHQMPNGQDFINLLKKQLSTLEQGKTS